MGIAKICTNGYWAIDGIPIYVPTKVEVSHDNIVTNDSGRKESGYMHVSWVRGDVRTVSFSYDQITGDEVHFVQQLVQGRTFVLTYYDEHQIKTMEGYTGKSKYKQKNLCAYADEGGLYEDYQFNVVEI